MKLVVPAYRDTADMNNERKAEMRVIRILAVCVLTAACQRDVPVGPEPPTAPAPAEVPAAALSAAEGAGLAAAITDAREWLLPSLAERGVPTDAIAGRLADLATTLARAENSALVSRIAAARQELEARAAENPAEQPIELAAFGLVLDGVEAVIRGKLRLVPADPAPPDAPQSPKDFKQRPTLDRSLP